MSQSGIGSSSNASGSISKSSRIQQRGTNAYVKQPSIHLEWDQKQMEKLNWFFHQEMHYLNRDIAEKTARECYPEIRDFTYDILWNDLPKEVQRQLMNEDETL